MRAPHLVAALLLTALLCACGEDAEPRSDDDATTPPSPPAPTTTDEPPSEPTTPSAPALLRAWQKEVLADETGKWTAEHSSFSMGGALAQTGAYDLAPIGVDMTTEIDHGPGPNTTYVVRTNDDGRWMQLSDGTYDVGRCWVDLDSPDLGNITGTAPENTPPAALEALFSAKRPRAAGRDVSLRTDLATVLSVIGVQLGDYRAPAVGAARTGILATVQDGRIDGWEADLQALFRDAAQAGFPHPDIRPADVAGQWLTVRFEQNPAPFAVPTPPRRLVRTYVADELEFEANLAGCGATLGPPGTPA